MNLENTSRSVSRRACIVCGQEFQGDTIICPHDGTTLTPLIQEDMVGKIIGEKYEVLEVIGGGGMGMIYKARHLLMKRLVAIKMMHPQYVSSASNLKRFQQEAQAASALSHPNILTVYDFGLTTEGAPYLVMDYLEGTNLAEVLDELGYLPSHRATGIFAQTSAGLAHAHSKGVIHRDLKPGNIMLVEFDKQQDFVKIVDFGIAKVMPSEGESNHLTQTGEVFGSPLYMSPEQCRGREMDARSDIYSLGCVMYRTLSGSSPFFGQDPLECMYKQVNEMPGSIFDLNPETQVPDALEAIVFKCLAKEPQERYQTMGELKDALEAFIQGTPLAVSTTSTTQMPEEGSQTPVKEATAGTSQNQALPESKTSALAETKVITVPPSQAVAASDLSSSAAPTDTGSNAAVNEASLSQKSTNVPQSGSSAPANQLTKYWPIAAAVALVLAGTGLFFAGRQSEPGVTSPPGQTATLVQGSFDAQMDEIEQYYLKADYPNAQKLINEILKRSDLTEQRRADALNQLADIQREAFQYDAAVKNYQQVLTIEQKNEQTKSEFEAHALNGLGHIATKRGQFSEAKGYLDKALAFDQNFTGDTHIEYARTCFELGNLALKEGKIAEASKYLNQAKNIIENAKSENDPETATVYNALAQVLQYQGKYKEAEKYYLKALKIRQTKLKPGNTATADTLLCLGTLNFNLHKYGAAQEQLQQALSSYKTAFGNNNETCGEINFCLAVLYDQQKKYAEAEPYYKDAWATQKSLLGATNPKTVRTQKYYAALLNKLHKTAEAQKVLSGR